MLTVFNAAIACAPTNICLPVRGWVRQGLCSLEYTFKAPTSHPSYPNPTTCTPYFTAAWPSCNQHYPKPRAQPAPLTSKRLKPSPRQPVGTSTTKSLMPPRSKRRRLLLPTPPDANWCLPAAVLAPIISEASEHAASPSSNGPACPPDPKSLTKTLGLARPASKVAASAPGRSEVVTDITQGSSSSAGRAALLVPSSGVSTNRSRSVCLLPFPAPSHALQGKSQLRPELGCITSTWDRCHDTHYRFGGHGLREGESRLGVGLIGVWKIGGDGGLSEQIHCLADSLRREAATGSLEARMQVPGLMTWHVGMGSKGQEVCHHCNGHVSRDS